MLSFPIEDEPGPTGRSPDFGGTGPGTTAEQGTLTLLGDVVICPSVAAANAVEHEVTLDDELALLVVHGLAPPPRHGPREGGRGRAHGGAGAAAARPLLPGGQTGVSGGGRAHPVGRVGLPRRGRHPHRRHRRAAGRLGRPRHGRDEPGAHEQDQGQVAGRRQAPRRPARWPSSSRTRPTSSTPSCCWCWSASWCRPPWSASWPSTSSVGLGRRARHRLRSRRDLRLLRGGPEELGRQHPDRAALLSAPLVSTLIRFPPIRGSRACSSAWPTCIIGAAATKARTAARTPTSPTPSSRPWPTWPTRRT